MQNLWLKIKIWTKITIAAAIVLYVLIFVLKNGDRKADFWFWFGREYSGSLLSLVFFAFLIGGLVTILATTTFRTVRQIRELRARSRTAKLEDEVRDMRSKAAMLQTRQPGAVGGAGVMKIDVAPPISDVPPAPPKP
jgi:uncharacterized integral membrane protein